MPSNLEFVNAIFGKDAPWCHVTDFQYDPLNIPDDKRHIAWGGDYFSRYTLTPDTNQYFTISCFYADDTGKARRRKALYRHTPCIVLDDVREKLCEEQVKKLPSPSWILETSPGSEQWGYILAEPCTDRARVENLLDGLVANGLAPGGRDPGMKGVTRYVRLPDGVNTKASKMVDGQPFKCRMLLWEPFRRTTMETLAAPFAVDLDKPRREQCVDGAADIPDHPLLQIPDTIHIKEVRSDGRFDITCPWVEEHTGADNSGSAIFTNEDGSIGFKCHHGACQSRTGRDLFQFIEGEKPGFGSKFASWRGLRALAPVSTLNFYGPGEAQASSPTSDIQQKDCEPQDVASAGLDQLLNQLRQVNPSSADARSTASTLLQLVDSLPAIEKKHWHDQVCDIMHWSKADFKPILRELREQWYQKTKTADWYNDFVYLREQNLFYNFKTYIFFTPEGFQNSYADKETEARKEALQAGRVKKVDKLDFAPKQPRYFTDAGIDYANAWSPDDEIASTQGDVTRWLSHWDAMGWGEYRDHMLKFMAYTILHPDVKINHMLMLGGGEGCGKDFLLYPLTMAMGRNSTTIDGEELLTDYRGYLLSTKHLHINEAELGTRQEAVAISNKLKPLAAAPPDTLRVNEKFMKAVKIRNIVNCTMTTNSQLPVRLNGPSRRIYAMWSHLNIRGEDGNVTAEWQRYWRESWEWMKSEGAAACVWYLRNCVDISNFNPGAPPPMTEFLREIQEASKSPAQVTIEEFIRKRVFQCDLLTAADMSAVLRAAELSSELRNLMSMEPSWFTPTRVGQVLREMPQCRQVKAYKSRYSMRVWILRDVVKYEELGCGARLVEEYDRQQKEIKKGNSIRAV